MDGIARIDTVAEYFEVWLDPELFPVPKMKVKVLDRANDFLAVPNLHRWNPTSGSPECLSGLGDSIQSAHEDLLKHYVADAREQRPDSGYAENDFVWSASKPGRLLLKHP
jgi:hypothetical protein